MADTFKQALERYRDAKEAFRDQRDRMLEDARFSNPAAPEQWDEQAIQIRRNGPDGARPCLTLDHTNQYIRQVVNDSRQNKPGLQALPAGGGSRIEVARAIEGMFRHIEYRSRAQIAYDTAIEHAARMGLGWIRVIPEVVNDELNWQEVRICRVHNPLAIVCDPDWTEPDGSDIKWGFIESTMTKELFKATYPKASLQPFEGKTPGGAWFQENGIKVAEYLEVVEKEQQRIVIDMPDGTKRDVDSDGYWQIRNGELGGMQPPIMAYKGKSRQVMWRKMSGAEVLEETIFPSRWTGLIPVLGNEIWIDDKRHLSGMVRSMMEAQRAYNYERSAYVEAVALQPKAPYVAAAEAVEGHEDVWAAANRQNKSYLPWNAFDENGQALPMPQRLAPPALPVAFAQGAQFADNDIQASVGMYRAAIGAPTAEHSGVALRAKRQEGDTANFHFIDNLSRSIEMVGRVVVDMIPRLYDEPREARILGIDGTAKVVKIDNSGDVYSVRPDGAETINLGTGEYDVRCKAGPSYTTLREEASDHLGQLMSGKPELAAVIAPIWARMQDWPEADKLSKALLAMAPPPVQQALSEDQQQDDPEVVKQQLQQAQQQLEQCQQMLQQMGQELQQAQNDQQKNRLDALAKAADTSVRQYVAETQRMQVLAPALGEQQVEAVVTRMLQEVLGAQPLGVQGPLPPVPGGGGDTPLAPEPPAMAEHQNGPPSGGPSHSGAGE